MTGLPRVSPRQRECLQLVWDRQATSKEIAAQLGISKATVDGYIAEAVEQLGARDRREAAAMLFGGGPRGVSGGDPARVTPAPAAEASPAVSTEVVPASRPWRSRNRPFNTLTFAQTVGWIAVIAVGSLAALALALSVGNGLPPIAQPLLSTFDRLTH